MFPRSLPDSQNVFQESLRQAKCLPGASKTVKMRPGASQTSNELSGKLLEVILAVWEAPGNYFGCLGNFWESFWLTGKFLEAILALWEVPGSHFGCLGSSCESFGLSRKLLGAVCREQIVEDNCLKPAQFGIPL